MKQILKCENDGNERKTNMQKYKCAKIENVKCYHPFGMPFR
jgi:hypothetical protein